MNPSPPRAPWSTEKGMLRQEGLCPAYALKELVPTARLGWLYDPSTRTTAVMGETKRVMEEAARSLGVILVSIAVRSAGDLDAAIAAAARDGAEGLCLGPEDLFSVHRERVIALAARHRLPAIYSYPPWVDGGGLMAFGEDVRALNRDAARLVDHILRGASPATLPVQQASKFNLSINVKTARTLGITVPPALLLRADKVLE